MTFEEAKEVFINRGFVNGIFNGDKWRESVAIISKWLEQEPCEDCVSRKAVLNKKELVELEDGQSFYCINPEDVETLPSVTPIESEEKTNEKD